MTAIHDGNTVLASRSAAHGPCICLQQTALSYGNERPLPIGCPYLQNGQASNSNRRSGWSGSACRARPASPALTPRLKGILASDARPLVVTYMLHTQERI